MATINDLYEAVKNGTAKVLTLESAKELKGKRIATIYYGYKGQNGFDEFVVGEIKSSFDVAEGVKPCGKFESQAKYWESYMSERQLDVKKTELELLTEDHRETYMFARTKYYNYYEEPTFTCSDADREVYYIEVTDEN